VHLRVEVRLVVVVRHRIVRPSDLGEGHRLVERHLGLCRLEFDGRVPGAAIRAAEAGAERMRMRERGIDDGGVGTNGQQLLGADAGRAALLGEQAVVGGAIQREDRLQVGFVVSDADEDAIAARRVARRHQPMRAVAPHRRDGREAHQPARRASSRRRTASIAGTPPHSM
jgi:hypothetical protein